MLYKYSHRNLYKRTVCFVFKENMEFKEQYKLFRRIQKLKPNTGFSYDGKFRLRYAISDVDRKLLEGMLSVFRRDDILIVSKDGSIPLEFPYQGIQFCKDTRLVYNRPKPNDPLEVLLFEPDKDTKIYF